MHYEPPLPFSLQSAALSSQAVGDVTACDGEMFLSTTYYAARSMLRQELKPLNIKVFMAINWAMAGQSYGRQRCGCYWMTRSAE